MNSNNSNPAHIQSFLDSLVPMFLVVDEALNEWKGEGCHQFPALMSTITLKMGWNGKEGEKTARAKEPIIREYVRNHPDWHVTRGAHGGIMRRSEKDKKEATKLAKDQAKAELVVALEAEVARKKAEALAKQSAPVTTVADTDIASE